MPDLMFRIDPKAKIISTSTILILSGILIGMSIERYVDLGLQTYSLAAGVAGMIGMIAYLTVELAASQRIRKALEREQSLVEKRLDRHTQPRESIGFLQSAETLRNRSRIDENHELNHSESSSDQLIVSA